MTAGRVIAEPRTARAAAMATQEIGRDAAFVEKQILAHVAQGRHASPLPPRGRDSKPALLGVYRCLTVKPSRSIARQSVLSAARVGSACCSSASVALGCTLINATRRASSSSDQAPPPNLWSAGAARSIRCRADAALGALYAVVPGGPLPPPNQLPKVYNKLQQLRADVRHRLSSQAACETLVPVRAISSLGLCVRPDCRRQHRPAQFAGPGIRLPSVRGTLPVVSLMYFW